MEEKHRGNHRRQHRRRRRHDPTVRTRVAIVGAGPAGLLLSHLLDAAGIPSVVIDQRSRDEIESTIRAGILEQGTVELLDTLGDASRVRTVGHRHDGIELRFAGEGHRIDFPSLVGRSVWLYPQHEVLKDLIAARLAAGQDLRFGVTADSIVDADTDRPRVIARDAEGQPFEIEAEFVVGSDGSRSVARAAVTGSSTGGYFREYPFAWFGILCEAPPSSDELIYSNSPDGFALISQRSATVQRMYFQCDPETDTAAYSEAQLWDELQKRVPGTTLKEGPIFQRDVLRFRSFVAHELLRGRVALVGDAAHTVPPTGAKGMNLAVADVRLLADALNALLLEGDARPLETYPERALQRIWKAQHFSWWMTSLLHVTPDATDFDRRRQLGELRSWSSPSTARPTWPRRTRAGRWPERARGRNPPPGRLPVADSDPLVGCCRRHFPARRGRRSTITKPPATSSAAASSPAPSGSSAPVTARPPALPVAFGAAAAPGAALDVGVGPAVALGVGVGVAVVLGGVGCRRRRRRRRHGILHRHRRLHEPVARDRTGHRERRARREGVGVDGIPPHLGLRQGLLVRRALAAHGVDGRGQRRSDPGLRLHGDGVGRDETVRLVGGQDAVVLRDGDGQDRAVTRRGGQVPLLHDGPVAGREARRAERHVALAAVVRRLVDEGEDAGIAVDVALVRTEHGRPLALDEGRRPPRGRDVGLAVADPAWRGSQSLPVRPNHGSFSGVIVPVRLCERSTRGMSAPSVTVKR